MKRRRRLLVLLVVVVLYIGCALHCWSWFAQPRPRHILGEACWPCAFTSDGQHVVTYKRWWRSTRNGGSGEEATGPIQLWDLRTGSVMASFLDEQRHVDYHVELSPDDRWFAIQEGKDYKNDKLRVIDLRSGNEQRAFDVPTDAKACWSFFRFSPGGQLFAANTGKQGDEQITVW